MDDFTEKLRSDLVEQFRGKPNIEALASVIARQLQDVFTFYEQLRLERDVRSAVRKQLDGIGNIVSLSRTEAGLLAGDPIPYEVLDDDKYRKFLIYKILKNTTHTTYPDIIRAFKMFWDRPLYYREEPDQPATMIFDTGEMDGPVDTSPLFDTPLIRAAGVTLKIRATTRTELGTALAGVVGSLGYPATSTELPQLEREIGFDTVVRIGSEFMNVAEDDLPVEERRISYDAKVNSGSAVQSIMETPIGDVAARTTARH